MYVGPMFKIGDDEAIAHLRQRGFGLLVVPTAAAPVGVHVPFLVERGKDGQLRLELHVARANPIHTHIGAGAAVLVVVTGGDAYISPDWYGVPNQVPTWLYSAVHVTGLARVLEEAQRGDHSDRLSAEFEARLAPKPPWTSAKMDPSRRDAMLSAIVGIEVQVETIMAQRKLIQHKGEIEHRGAIAGLRGQGDVGSRLVADQIEAAGRQKFKW